MKTVLVTGSAGFIGWHLVQCLVEQGNIVVEADCKTGQDLCDPDIVANLPEVDQIYHLAMVNNTSAFYTQPYTIIQNSIIPLHNILKRYKGVPVIYTSSSETYAGGVNLGTVPVPTPETVPLVIDDITNPRWSYATSKIIGESQVVSASVEYGTPYKIIRYHNVYGARQKNHFLPDFIERCLKGKYELYGHSATRSWCYIDDAVYATTVIAQQGDQTVYNVGAENEHKILEVAEMVLHKLGIDAELELHLEPPGSVSRRCPDITRLKALGFTPTVDLSTGLDLLLKKQYGIKNK